MSLTIIKRPYSKPKVEYYKSNNLPDLITETGLKLSPHSLGGGLLLLYQVSNDYDEPNVILDDEIIKGLFIVCRISRDKILDIYDSDLEILNTIIKDIGEDNEVNWNS